MADRSQRLRRWCRLPSATRWCRAKVAGC